MCRVCARIQVVVQRERATRHTWHQWSPRARAGVRVEIQARIVWSLVLSPCTIARRAYLHAIRRDDCEGGRAGRFAMQLCWASSGRDRLRCAKVIFDVVEGRRRRHKGEGRRLALRQRAQLLHDARQRKAYNLERL